MSPRFPHLAALALLGLLLTGCTGPVVVVYTSVDQPFAEPVLASFTAATGITVRPLFDTEAAKTVGLVSRLRAEAANPQCDVFWNSEFANTVRMAREGLFEAWLPPAASDVPALFRDPDGYWTGIGARARVLLVNTALVATADHPLGLEDLASPRWSAGQVAVSLPLAGTGLTHAAAFRAAGGEAGLLAFYSRLQGAGVQFLDGNATVRDRVAAGAMQVCLTDSDDALMALARGAPVRMILPDQGPGGSGTLLIPNTVALIKNAPHPLEARRLVDFLVSAEAERMLARGESRQIPVRPALQGECDWLPAGGIKGYDLPLAAIADALPSATAELKGMFLK